MTTPTPDREALARIIDPWAFEARWDDGLHRPAGNSIEVARNDAYAKADQWLARSSGGGEAETEKYAALGRAAESHGLAWFAEDGSHLFQPPMDYIADQARQEGHDEALAALPPPAPSGVGESVEALPELTADFVRALPGIGMDDSSYEKIEQALDKIGAPVTAENNTTNKFLTLVQRIEALSGVVELKEAAEEAEDILDDFLGLDPDGEPDTEHERILARLRAAIAAVPMEGKSNGG